jgi:hypothetical protein
MRRPYVLLKVISLSTSPRHLAPAYSFKDDASMAEGDEFAEFETDAATFDAMLEQTEPAELVPLDQEQRDDWRAAFAVRQLQGGPAAGFGADEHPAQC